MKYSYHDWWCFRKDETISHKEHRTTIVHRTPESIRVFLLQSRQLLSTPCQSPTCSVSRIRIRIVSPALWICKSWLWRGKTTTTRTAKYQSRVFWNFLNQFRFERMKSGNRGSNVSTMSSLRLHGYAFKSEGWYWKWGVQKLSKNWENGFSDLTEIGGVDYSSSERFWLVLIGSTRHYNWRLEWYKQYSYRSYNSSARITTVSYNRPHVNTLQNTFQTEPTDVITVTSLYSAHQYPDDKAHPVQRSTCS